MRSLCWLLGMDCAPVTFVNCRSCPTSRMRSAHTCSMGAQRRRTAPFFFATAHRSSRSRPRTTSPQSVCWLLGMDCAPCDIRQLPLLPDVADALSAYLLDGQERQL